MVLLSHALFNTSYSVVSKWVLIAIVVLLILAFVFVRWMIKKAFKLAILVLVVTVLLSFTGVGYLGLLQGSIKKESLIQNLYVSQALKLAGTVQKGSILLMKDINLWHFLDSSTPRFNFETRKTQYLIFDYPAQIIFKPVKVGQVIAFPRISNTEIPFGITFKIISKSIKNGKLYLGVVEPPNARIMTKQDLQQMLKQKGKLIKK